MLEKRVISALLLFSMLVGAASAANGLNAKYYNPDNFYRADWNAVGIPDATQIDPNINFNWQPIGPNPLPSGIISDGWWSADWEGFINIPTTGAYTFATTSDDGSMVYIDGSVVVNNAGDHGPLHVDGAPVTLTVGMHPIKVKYFESYGGPAQLYLYWTVPSESEAIVPNSVLFTENPTNVPEFPTIALPIVSVIGLMLLFHRKTGK